MSGDSDFPPPYRPCAPSRKRISPVELTNVCLARIARGNSRLKAFVTVTEEQTRAQAREAERAITAGDWRGTQCVQRCGLRGSPRLDAVRKWGLFERPSYALPFNLTGQPALSLCCGFGEEGLPLAIQLAARPLDELTLLRVGHVYETATPWRNRRPAPIDAHAS